MIMVRAACIAALSLFLMSGGATAQDVTLTSHDGDVEISGNLLGYDGEFYRVETIYGELTVDGSGVSCAGPGCPNLDNYIARVTFSGAPTIGRVLMPALIEAFAFHGEYEVERKNKSARRFLYRIRDKETRQTLAEFTFRLSNTDEGFADLLANEADVAMALREARSEEIARARQAGLGVLTDQGRSRILALDALVPVVAPTNPVQAITMKKLSEVLSGDLVNWSDLGGPDAPVAVHILDDRSGLGQTTVDRLLAPGNRDLSESAIRHDDNPALLEAVIEDSFALGVTSRSEMGNTWELALQGSCGFTLNATRQAIKAEDYPLTAPMFLYLPARRFPKLMREFLGYLRDPTAQLVIRRAGFVDQTPEEIPVNAQGDRFANAILRAGDEVQLDDLQDMVRTLKPLKRLTTTFRFESGSARLDAQSRSNVEQLARAMEVGRYDGRRLVFVGFSDGEGSVSRNGEIAKRRASVVRSAVENAAETANLSQIGLQTVSFGEAMPMACDDSAWGRQVNRRVEVWVR